MVSLLGFFGVFGCLALGWVHWCEADGSWSWWRELVWAVGCGAGLVGFWCVAALGLWGVL